MKQHYVYAVVVLFFNGYLFSMPRSKSYREVNKWLDASYAKEIKHNDDESLCAKERKKRAWLSASIDTVLPKANPCALQPGPLGESDGNCA